MTRPAVGVIGLGPMGAPIATHLARAGFPLQVWNRTPAKADGIGGQLVAHPADLRADIVLSVLPDVDQFDEVAPAPVARCWAKHGTTHVVVLSTTSRDKIRGLARRLDQLGISVVDAPMSGGDAGARAGTLSLMVGASDDAFAAAAPVLRVFAGTVEHLGPVGAGTAAKLCNQVIVAGTLIAVAEALADDVGAHLGQGRHGAALFAELITRGLGGADHAAVYELVAALGRAESPPDGGAGKPGGDSA